MVDVHRVARHHVALIIRQFRDVARREPGKLHLPLILAIGVPVTSAFDDWGQAQWDRLYVPPEHCGDNDTTRLFCRLQNFLASRPVTCVALAPYIIGGPSELPRPLLVDISLLLPRNPFELRSRSPIFHNDVLDTFFANVPVVEMDLLWNRASAALTTAFYAEIGDMKELEDNYIRYANGHIYKEEILALVTAGDGFFAEDIRRILHDPTVYPRREVHLTWRTIVMLKKNRERGTEEVAAFAIFYTAPHPSISGKKTVLLDLRFLFVAPRYRGRNLAPQLLDFVVTLGEQNRRGHQVLVELVAKEDERVFRFWFSNRGFVPEGGRGLGHRVFSAQPLLRVLEVDDGQLAKEVREAKECLDLT